MSLLLPLIVIPILAAVLIIAGAPARKTAIAGAALNLLWSIFVFSSYSLVDGGYQFVSTLAVAPTYGINFILGADGLSLAMLMLSTVVTLSAVCVARVPERSPNLFFASLLFISAGGIGAFASIDAFFFYMFHELALIPTFLLIGIWGSGDRQAAAWKATIYLAFGSFVLLIGLIGLYLSMPVGARSFDMRAIREIAELGALHPHNSVYLLLFFGFGILVSLFPFHTWAPQAYASAPAPAAMLHAGVLKKFGLYGILRLITPIFPAAIIETRIDINLYFCELSFTYANLLIVLLLGNIFYIGFVTISQRKLDWMLGYSSVMHMGYIFLGLLAGTTLALHGSAFMLVAHGLSIAALFALCGELRERTGTLDFSELGGLARAMPRFGLLFAFAAMASIGLPGFANFAAEVMIFFGAFSAWPSQTGISQFQIATVIAVWGVVISAVYMLRAYRKIFLGPLPDRWKGLPDLATVPRLCVVALIVLLLIIGFQPHLFVNYLSTASIWP